MQTGTSPPPRRAYLSAPWFVPALLLVIAYGLLGFTFTSPITHANLMRRCVLADPNLARIWSVGNMEIGAAYLGVFFAMTWYFVRIFQKNRVHLQDLGIAVLYLIVSFCIDYACVRRLHPFAALLVGDVVVMTFTLLVSRQTWFQRLLGVFVPIIFLSCGVGHMLEGLSYWHLTYPLNVPWTMVTADIGFAVLVNSARFPTFIRGQDIAEELDTVRTQSEELQRSFAELTRTERALRRSEQRFEATFDLAAVGMAHVDGNGAWLRVNDRLCEILGYSREELLRMRFPEITHPDYLEASLAPFASIQSGEINAYTLEKRCIHKTGRPVWIYLSLSSARVPDGQPPYGIAVIEDISDRKRQQEEIATLNRDLQRRVQDFETLVETLPVAVYIAEDPQCRTIRGNGVARKLAGGPSESNLSLTASPEEPIARYRALRNGEEVPEDQLPLHLAVSTGQAVPDVGFDLQWSDGTVVNMFGGASPLFDEHGQVRGGIAAFVNITERKQLEDQFLQAQKMEGIGRLAGGVAHDFNNLLTAIMGYTEMAADELAPGDPARDYLANVSKAAEKASRLTQQLLAFARKQMVEPRVVPVNDLILDIYRLLSRLIGEDIELVTELKADAGAVRIDPGQLEQVVINMAVNARDAMPRGGALTIATGRVPAAGDALTRSADPGAGDYVALSLRDTGVGIPEDVKAHLFEPFYTTKETGKGTGLGLATCYGIVAQSGGYIEVTSEPGSGSTFQVFLPRIEPEAASVSVDPVLAVVPRGRETLLLAEDDPAVRAIAVQILRDQGYTVIEAENGLMALEVAHSFPGAIDLLVTDVVMPQLGGRDLHDRLTETRPAIRTLYCSGYSADIIGEHGVVETGLAFLAKPYTPASLARKVRAVLDG